MENPTYLGDAVYAYWNGSQIELRLDDHRSPTLIYLEPSTLENLNSFAAAVNPPPKAEVFDTTPEPQFRTFEYRIKMQEAADNGELIQKRFNGDRVWSPPYKQPTGEALHWDIFQYRKAE
jgi:hypothetical protein